LFFFFFPLLFTKVLIVDVWLQWIVFITADGFMTAEAHLRWGLARKGEQKRTAEELLLKSWHGNFFEKLALKNFQRCE
jgi:hypothetical protein